MACLMHYLQEELKRLVNDHKAISHFIQEHCLDGLWYWDLKKPEEKWADEHFWQTLGYAPREIPSKGIGWHELMPLEDYQAFEKEFLFKKIESPEGFREIVVRFRHRKGEFVWIHCRGIAVRDSNDQPIRMLGAHTELTKIGRENDMLRKQLKNYEVFVENLSLYFIKLDLAGNYSYVNDYYCYDFGFDKDALLGESSLCEIVEADQEKANEVGVKALQNPGKKYRAELTKKITGGGLRTGEWEFTADVDDYGNVIGLICFGYDVTAKKKAEKAKQEALDKFDFISSNTSDSIILMENGRIIHSSASHEKLFGYTTEEVMKFTEQDIFERIHPEDRDDVFTHIYHCID